MEDRRILFFIIIIFLCFFILPASFAGQEALTARESAMLATFNQLQAREWRGQIQVPFTPRENAVFTALNQLEARDAVMMDALQGVEMKTYKGKGSPPRKRMTAFYMHNPLSRIHSYLITKTQFGDNIYSTRSERKKDFTYNVVPGVRSSFPLPGAYLNLDMNVDNQYDRHHTQNNLQVAEGSVSTSLGLGRTTLSISDNYVTNYVSSNSFGIERDKIAFYWKDAFGSTLGRNFNRIGFNLGYGRTEYGYDYDNRLLDSVADSISFSQYLRIAKKTKLTLGYNYARTKYLRIPSSSQDSRDDTFNLELAGVLSPKITGTLATSYHFLEAKESADYRERNFVLSFGYAITGRSNLALSLREGIHREANIDNYRLDHSFGLSANHRLAFNPKLSISFANSVSYTDNPKMAGRRTQDKVFGLTLGLDYAFRRWLDMSLSWSQVRYDYDLSADYYNNGVLFKTQAKF